MVKFFAALIMTLQIFIPSVSAAEMPSIENEPYFNKTVAEFATGNFSLNPINIIQDMGKILFNEVIRSREMLASMLMIGTASSVASLIQTAFGTKGVGESAFYGCFCIMCASTVECFSIALRYAKDTVMLMNTFVTKLSPIISSLLIMSGKAASASVFHPVLSTGVYAVALIVENWLIPLITYGTVLSVVNNMSTDVRISGVCKLINSITKWILAAAFTLFSGLCAIYGFGAPAIDAMSAKTMKFAIGSLVPVVGGFLSETLDTVISGSAMMKSVVGGAGIAALCAMCAVPVIKIGAIILMMKITAAVIEPVTDKRISGLLWDMSASVTMLFAMVVTMAVLFIICISIIVGSTK